MDRDLQNERKEKNPDSLIKFPAMEKDSLRIRFRRRNFRPQITFICVILIDLWRFTLLHVSVSSSTQSSDMVIRRQFFT